MKREVILAKVLELQKACEEVIKDYEHAKKFQDEDFLKLQKEFYSGY